MNETSKRINDSDEPAVKRNKFYTEYYSTHAGDLAINIIEKQIKLEAIYYHHEIIPLISKDKNISILDIGCGYGSLIYTLKKAGYSKVKGIDISEEMVKMAHQLKINEITQTDLKPFLETTDLKFDLITGIDIIEHFKRDELLEILNQLHTILNPGGKVLFRTPNIDAPFGTSFSFGDATHELYLNSSSAKQILLNAGFKRVKIMPSFIYTGNRVMNLFRKLLWWKIKSLSKIVIFASGKSTRNIVLSPNLIIFAS